jgi:hypothetical protein
VFKNRVLRRIFGPKRDKVTGVENYTYQGTFCSVLLTKYYSGYQEEMGRACSTFGKEKGCIHGFGGET